MPLRLVALSLLSILVLGCTHERDDASASSSPEEGFVTLLNGKDLSGWTHVTKVGQGYRIRDGALYCTVVDGGVLYTEKEYSDFVLRFEFKLTPNANNGIAIRAPREGNAAYLGMEIQVLDDSGSKYTQLRPEQYHGSIYDLVAAEKGHLKPVGEWNEQEITARGRQIKVKLNGATIVDANLDDIKDPAKLAKHPGIQNKSGHLGFLGHGAEVDFRNVRIKDVASDSSAETQPK